MRRDASDILARVQAKWVLVALIFLAAGLRLWRLNVLPPGLFFDEAYNGLDASHVLAGIARPIFFAGNNGREPLFIYLEAIAVALLGPTPLALRMTSAAIGIATIPIIYFTARGILSPDPTESDPPPIGARLTPWFALIAAAGLAISYWHVSLSRLGFRAGLLVPVSALAIAFFWRGWTRGRWRDYLLAGLFFGVAFYVYTAARALPLVVLAFVLLESGLSLARHRSNRGQIRELWKPRLMGLALMAVIACLIAVPLAITIRNDPSLFTARTQDVSILSASQQEMPGATAENLLANVVAVARNFYDQGDQQLRHNLPGRPVNDPVLAVLFTLGWLGAIWQIRRPRNRLLLIWLAVMLTPTVLSTEAPHSLRSAGALPALAMFYAVGGEVVFVAWTSLRNRRQARLRGAQPDASQPAPRTIQDRSLLIPACILLLIVVVSGGLTVRDYFQRWATSPELGGAFDVDLQLAAAEAAAVLDEPGTNQSVILTGDLFAQSQLRFAMGRPVLQYSSLPDTLSDPSERSRSTRFIFDRSFDSDRPLVLLWREGDHIASVWPGPLVVETDESVRQEEDSLLFSRPLVWPTDEFGWPGVFTGLLPAQAYFCPSAAPLPLWADFANGMQLLGYDIDVDRGALGDSPDLLRLTLYWQKRQTASTAIALPEEQTRLDDFGVAVDLISDQLVTQTQDGPLPVDWIRNREYAGGQVVEDVRVFSIPPESASDKALFRVGMYQLSPGQPSDQDNATIPLVDGEGRAIANWLTLDGGALEEQASQALSEARACLDHATDRPFDGQAWEDDLAWLAQNTDQPPPLVRTGQTEQNQNADLPPIQFQASRTERSPYLSAMPGMRYPLDRYFANGMKLLAYDLQPDAVDLSSGAQKVRLHLFWQGDETNSADAAEARGVKWWSRSEFDVFAHLIAGDTVWQTANHRFLGERRLLAQGDILEDVREFSLPKDTPPGKAHFEIGLYYYSNADSSGDPNPRIPLVNLEGQAVDDMVTLGGMAIGLIPRVDQVPSLHIGADFEDHIRLTDLRIAQDANEPLAIEAVLDWQALDRPEMDYTAFVHLVDQDQKIVAQYDQPLGGVTNPTHLWAPKETVRAVFPLRLPAGANVDDLTLRIGLYNTYSGDGLPILGVVADQVNLPDRTYLLLPLAAAM